MTTFVWSSRPAPSDFISPYNDYYFAFIDDPKYNDKCRGPVARSDSSEGLLNHIWEIYYDVDSSDVYIYRQDLPETEYLIFNKDDIFWVGLSFDQNGKEFITYHVKTDVVSQIWIYWYDPTLEYFTHSNLCDGEMPFCRLDYATIFEFNINSIIVLYQRSGVVYYRNQLDRFVAEHTMFTATDANLLNLLSAGFTKQYRFQLLYKDEPLASESAVFSLPEDLILIDKGEIAKTDSLPITFYQGAVHDYQLTLIKFYYPLDNSLDDSFEIISVSDASDKFAIFISDRLGNSDGAALYNVSSGTTIDYSTLGLTADTDYYVHIMVMQDTEVFTVEFT